MSRAIITTIILFSVARFSSADLLKVKIPRTNLVIMLQGRVIYNAGGTVTLRHPLGSLFFSTEDVVNRYEVPPIENLIKNRMVRSKTADEAMQFARQALKRGFMTLFDEGVDKALKLDSQHRGALNVKQLQRQFEVDLGPWTEQERELRKAVRLQHMEIATSAHFILLHDTPKIPQKVSDQARRHRPRSEERLALLEKVYESFLLMFYSQGVELEIPKERLKVVLFNQEYNFKQFATSLSSDLGSALGFYDPRSNISFFFDHGSSERLKGLRELSAKLQSGIPEARREKDKDYIRVAELITMLAEIDRENADIEVVTHEATHQMAGNTGLFPRHILVPSWVHEGLATYFEAPDDATWSGMGAVNEERLEWYRALGSPRESSLQFLVGDKIFKNARTHGAVLHGYGQAWALTHFLMEKHFKEFMAFYDRVGQMPPDFPLTPEILNTIFDQVFTIERRELLDQWKKYMRSLKTDTEVILTR